MNSWVGSLDTFCLVPSKSGVKILSTILLNTGLEIQNIRNLHLLCTDKDLGDYKSCLADFRQKFMVMFEKYDLSWTLKIHVILDHYPTYFEKTGKSMRHSNGEFPEGAHYTLKKHEVRHGFVQRKGLGTLGHVQKSARSLSHLNSRKIGSTPPLRLRKSPFSSPLSSFSPPSQTKVSSSVSSPLSSFSSPSQSTVSSSFSSPTPSRLSTTSFE